MAAIAVTMPDSVPALGKSDICLSGWEQDAGQRTARSLLSWMNECCGNSKLAYAIIHDAIGSAIVEVAGSLVDYQQFMSVADKAMVIRVWLLAWSGLGYKKSGRKLVYRGRP